MPASAGLIIIKIMRHGKGCECGQLIDGSDQNWQWPPAKLARDEVAEAWGHVQLLHMFRHLYVNENKLPPKTTQRNHDMSPTNNSRAWSYNPVPASVSNFELSAMIVRLIIIEMGHGTDCERQLVNASNGQMKANWWRQYLYPQQTLNVCSHLSIPDTSLPRGLFIINNTV